ncbi:uncharacterized protein EV422DRAFT_534604 [Fimicolochytrium jonesii]|uniref:uncharacterized protein n=1 Tax=Fimicolochytrium jonesii TaxID=1396493 RepID=UPI0022FF311A|nr:uncharacterized protein EV422DRAFT_534604 [Fimicolochytrium jonesii]KAI8819406.1 hypothetical protein EV422DRAFT_534604 [Fimicolochytrium jonesii]
MDFSQIPKIRRQLRQMRSRLSAFSETGEQYQPLNKGTTSSTAGQGCVNRTTGANSPTPNFLDLCRPPGKVTQKYGKSKNRQRQVLAPKSPSLLASYVQGDMMNLASPIRRQTLGFQEYFREVARNVWGSHHAKEVSATYRDDENSQHILKPERVSSLAELSAFALARNLPLATTDNEEDLGLEEEWYEAVPPHHRRAVLWAHIIELCKAFIPSAKVLVPVVDACINAQAPQQAWELLVYFWSLPGGRTLHDMAWSFSVASRLTKSTEWVHTVGRQLRTSECHLIEDVLVRKYLDGCQSELLIVHGLRTLLNMDNQNMTTSQTRINPWIRKLLRHSCVSCSQLYDCLCTATILEICARIDSMPSELSPTYRLALLCRGTELVDMITPSALLNEPPEWVGHLRDHNHLHDLDEMVAFYPTFQAMGNVRQALLAIDAIPLARKINLLMLNHYDTLAKGAGHVPLIEELKAQLEVQATPRPDKTSRWRYEPLLQTWIASTPLPNGTNTQKPSTLPHPSPIYARTRSFIHKTSAQHTPPRQFHFLDKKNRPRVRTLPPTHNTAFFNPSSKRAAEALWEPDTPVSRPAKRSHIDPACTPPAPVLRRHMSDPGGGRGRRTVVVKAGDMTAGDLQYMASESLGDTDNAPLEMRVVEPLPMTMEEDDLAF